MKTNGEDPINPSTISINEQGQYNPQVGNDQWQVSGLTKREYFAAISTDDFTSLPISLQGEIIGYDPPSYEYDPGFDEIKEIRAAFNMDYALWLAKGRAKWKLMQAEALIKALNEQ